MSAPLFLIVTTVADVPPQVEWFANLSWQTPHRSGRAAPVALHEVDAKTTDLHGEQIAQDDVERIRP
jgi:hypothetical protein